MADFANDAGRCGSAFACAWTEDVMRVVVMIAVSAALAASACGGGNTDPQRGQTAPGSRVTAKTATLESAANLIQSKGPISKVSLYLDGFHAAKDDAKMQMEAHHYCNQANEDFAQCVLFDGNT